MPPVSRIVPPLEILHRLPARSWFRQSYERGNHDWLNASTALVITGPATLDELDFDHLPLPEGIADDTATREAISLLLVEGDLHVRGPVHVHNTDGNAGLVVLGNLHAHALLVGGQEIRVTGNLTVDTLCWGDYNHGSLHVAGHAKAQAWLATDEYAMELPESAEGVRWLESEGNQPAPNYASLSRLFRRDALRTDPDHSLDDGDDLNNWLDSGALVAASRRGEALLPGLEATPPQLAPARLSGTALCVENLAALLDTPLRRWAPEDGRIDLSDGELRCSLFPNAPKPQMQLRDVETRYWLTLEPAVDSLLPWKRKPARIKAERANGEGEPRWQPLALDDAHLQTLWNHWLPLIGQTERLRPHIEERITPARIAHLLALPYTRKTFSEWAEGEYFGSVYLAVRQAQEGRPRLSIAWQGSEALNEDGQRDYCFFHYDLATAEDGALYCELFYQPEQEASTDTWHALSLPCLYPLLLEQFDVLADVLERSQRGLELETAHARAEAQKALDAPPRYIDMPLGDDEDAPTHRFRVLPCHAVISELDALCFQNQPSLPASDTDGVFLVAEGDCSLPYLELLTGHDSLHDEDIVGYLFRGSLHVEQYLEAYDIDHSPQLAITGNLRARNVKLHGAGVHVGGELHAQCLYGFYNHGHLDVAGLLNTDVLVAQDFQIRSSRLQAHAIITRTSVLSFNDYEDDEGVWHQSLDCFPANARASDVFDAELCDLTPFHGHYFPDYQRLGERMRSGGEAFDRERLNRHTGQMPAAHEVRRIFEWVFASPRLLDGELRVFQGNQPDSLQHAFALRNEAGTRWIGLQMGGGYDYQVCLRLDADGSVSAAHYLLANDARPQSISYVEPLGDTHLSPRAAVHGFREALERLGLLGYGQTLPAGAPPESAADLPPLLDALRARHAQETTQLGREAACSRLKTALEQIQHKTQTLCGLDSAPMSHWAELALQAYAADWSKQDAALGAAGLCLRFQHPLHDPQAFTATLAVLKPGKEHQAGHAQLLQAAIAWLQPQSVDATALQTRRAGVRDEIAADEPAAGWAKAATALPEEFLRLLNGDASLQAVRQAWKKLLDARQADYQRQYESGRCPNWPEVRERMRADTALEDALLQQLLCLLHTLPGADASHQARIERWLDALNSSDFTLAGALAPVADNLLAYADGCIAEHDNLPSPAQAGAIASGLLELFFHHTSDDALRAEAALRIGDFAAAFPHARESLGLLAYLLGFHPQAARQAACILLEAPPVDEDDYAMADEIASDVFAPTQWHRGHGLGALAEDVVQAMLEQDPTLPQRLPALLPRLLYQPLDLDTRPLAHRIARLEAQLAEPSNSLTGSRRKALARLRENPEAVLAAEHEQAGKRLRRTPHVLRAALTLLAACPPGRERDELQALIATAQNRPPRRFLAPAQPQTVFADFGLKLLVIEQLMYASDLLQPRLSLEEFAEENPELEIDPDSIEPIPAIREYFERLDIPRELMAGIETLYQDDGCGGGAEVYREFWPGWDPGCGDEIVPVTAAALADLELLPALHTIESDSESPQEYLDPQVAQTLARRRGE